AEEQEGIKGSAAVIMQLGSVKQRIVRAAGERGWAGPRGCEHETVGLGRSVVRARTGKGSAAHRREGSTIIRLRSPPLATKQHLGGSCCQLTTLEKRCRVVADGDGVGAIDPAQVEPPVARGVVSKPAHLEAVLRPVGGARRSQAPAEGRPLGGGRADEA